MSAAGSAFLTYLPRHALRNAGIAFGMGLLLFALVWLNGRDQDFYPADAVVAGDSTPLPPLPEPLAAAVGASDMPSTTPRPAPVAEEAPQPTEMVALPPPSEAPSATVADPSASTAADMPDIAHSPSRGPADAPLPIPEQSPQPRYPANALRRGESGTVTVRVEVDAQGNPTSITLSGRSGSRDLDRAAMAAVRKWRFQPAQRDGKPVPSQIEIPINFKPYQ